jgi:hypothetical protein
MSRDKKICPDCETEYLPHIEKCADCGAVLIWPEDIEKAREKKKRLTEEAVKDEVAVREGDMNWLGELYNVLIDAGIPCAVRVDAACNKSCCGDKCRLVVSSGDAERAQEQIEEYFAKIHPEVRVSREMAGEGKCPACGSPVGPDDPECPDCGLPLVIVEEEDNKEQED